MIYLCSPYSHPDLEIRENRFRAACQAAVHLMHKGHVVFSPIAHTHPMTVYGLPTDWNFWKRQDAEFLRRCDEVWVLTLDGWQVSRGVEEEISMAKYYRKPIQYLSACGDTLARVAKEGNG